ncbi:MAG: hypothetical protein KDJ66_05295 [Nitratireductor sp.]|nr:hypothetical protein [Nitratireductor sp.]MCB1455768.1 hypothetical protein [Nitratireductor sp.]
MAIATLFLCRDATMNAVKQPFTSLQVTREQRFAAISPPFSSAALASGWQIWFWWQKNLYSKWWNRRFADQSHPPECGLTTNDIERKNA